MKNELARLGCLLWILVILALSAGSGWLVNQALASIIWMTVWVNIVLSVLSGIATVAVLSFISFLIIVVKDKTFDDSNPDFSGAI